MEGDQWNTRNSNEILKICQERNEHLLIADVRDWTRHLYIGSEWIGTAAAYLLVIDWSGEVFASLRRRQVAASLAGIILLMRRRRLMAITWLLLLLVVQMRMLLIGGLSSAAVAMMFVAAAVRNVRIAPFRTEEAVVPLAVNVDEPGAVFGPERH